MRNCIKGLGSRKVENHWCEAFRVHSSLFILICPKLPQQFSYPPPSLLQILLILHSPGIRKCRTDWRIQAQEAALTTPKLMDSALILTGN